MQNESSIDAIRQLPGGSLTNRNFGIRKRIQGLLSDNGCETALP
jgi:hypothetical protein